MQALANAPGIIGGYCPISRGTLEPVVTCVVEAIGLAVIFSVSSLYCDKTEDRNYFEDKAVSVFWWNIGIRVLMWVAQCAFEKASQTNIISPCPNLFLKTATTFIKDCGPSYNLGIYCNQTIGTIIHTYGHYYAIKYFDPIQDPIIKLYSRGAASTSYLAYTSFFQSLKHMIGYETPAVIENKAMITRAGPTAALLVATGLIFSSQIQNLPLKTKRFLFITGLLIIYSHPRC